MQDKIDIEYIDEETGYFCYIKNHSVYGHLCGYVAVPKNHPLNGVEYKNITTEIKKIHGLKYNGGLTYSGFVDGQWRFGFDCGHPSLGDHAPGGFDVYRIIDEGPGKKKSIFRDENFVRREIKKLAKQLKNGELNE